MVRTFYRISYYLIDETIFLIQTHTMFRKICQKEKKRSQQENLLFHTGTKMNKTTDTIKTNKRRKKSKTTKKNFKLCIELVLVHQIQTYSIYYMERFIHAI